MEQQNSSLLGTEEQPVVPPTSDEKTMAILSHILTLVVGFIAPLVIYLIKKDESSFINAHVQRIIEFSDYCNHCMYCSCYYNYWDSADLGGTPCCTRVGDHCYHQGK